MSRVPVKSQSRLEHDRLLARARDLEVKALPAEWRNRAAIAVTKTEQVRLVLLMLRRGVYHRGTTSLAMQRVWSLSEAAVVDREVEALRLFQLIIDENPGELLAEFVARIESIGQGALERTEEYIDRNGGRHVISKPDHRTALAAVVEAAELAGLRKTRIEIDVRTLSDEQIRTQLAAHGVTIVETTADPAGEEPAA